MLNCSGLVVIPNNHKFHEFKTEKGCYFSFNVASFDPNNEGYHLYSMSLWVADNEIEAWREKIQPNKVFLLKSADLAAPFKDAEKIPFVNIKTTTRNLMPLTKIFHEKKEK